MSVCDNHQCSPSCQRRVVKRVVIVLHCVGENRSPAGWSRGEIQYHRARLCFYDSQIVRCTWPNWKIKKDIYSHFYLFRHEQELKSKRFTHIRHKTFFFENESLFYSVWPPVQTYTKKKRSKTKILKNTFKILLKTETYLFRRDGKNAAIKNGCFFSVWPSLHT